MRCGIDSKNVSCEKKKRVNFKEGSLAIPWDIHWRHETELKQQIYKAIETQRHYPATKQKWIQIKRNYYCLKRRRLFQSEFLKCVIKVSKIIVTTTTLFKSNSASTSHYGKGRIFLSSFRTRVYLCRCKFNFQAIPRQTYIYNLSNIFSQYPCPILKQTCQHTFVVIEHKNHGARLSRLSNCLLSARFNLKVIFVSL